MSAGEGAQGWTEDRKRGMLCDKTGRFRVFRAAHQPGFHPSHYMLEDRKDGTLWAFETQTLAIDHAKQVMKDEKEEEHRKWIAQQRKKVKVKIEFRRVSSSGGFYYWKNAADRKAEREARYDNFPHAFGRVTDNR